MFGWAGRILKVDLTTGEIVKEAFDEDFAKSFLGGLGFNLKLIFDEFEPSEVKDPLDPANVICVSPGALGGTPVSGASRLVVSVGRSPTFPTFGDGNAGGRFAAELKWANYDAIVIKGKAPELVYLSIVDDHVELRDARHLKGKGVYETHRLLKEELRDRDVETMVIGPSGENLVYGAAPVVSGTRIPAGGSTGTVFGSKNLKGIAARGTKGIRISRPEELLLAAEEVYRTNVSGHMFPRWSREGSKWLVNLTGPNSPRYGVQLGRSFPFDKLRWSVFKQKYEVPERYKACDACYVHCDAIWRIKEGPYAGLTGRGVQHGVIRYFGYVPGISDYDGILHLSHLATDLGLESTVSGEVIGAALQCWQDGLLSAKDTGGLKLEWGNPSLVSELLDQIAHRKGFGGEWLAEGSEGIVAKLADRGLADKGREYFLHNRKGKDILVDPRAMQGAALSQGVEARANEVMTVDASFLGGPHTAETLQHIGIPAEVAAEFIKRGTVNTPIISPGKAHGKVFYDDFSMVCNSLGICKRHTSWESMRFGTELVAKCFVAATGVDYSWQDLHKCAARLWSIHQAMHVRFGLRRKDDVLPDWWFERPKPLEPRKGAVLNREDYEAALDEFYRLRGWDCNAVPTRTKLEELGLKDVAAKLEKSGILPKPAGKAGGRSNDRKG